MMNIRSVMPQQVASTATRQAATTNSTATNQTMGDIFSQQTDQSKAPNSQQLDINSLLGMLQSLIQQLMAVFSLGSEQQQQEEIQPESPSQPPAAPAGAGGAPAAGGEKSIMDFFEKFIEELLAKLDPKEKSGAPPPQAAAPQAAAPQAAAPQAAAPQAASNPASSAPVNCKPAELIRKQNRSKSEASKEPKTNEIFKRDEGKVLNSQPTENGGRIDKVKYGTSNQTREYNSDGTLTHKVAFKGDTDKKVNEDFFNDEGVRTKYIQYRHITPETVGNPKASTREYDEFGRTTKAVNFGDPDKPIINNYIPETEEVTRTYEDDSKRSKYTEVRNRYIAT